MVTDGGRIHAEGPDTGRREGWGASFWVSTPRRSDVQKETPNGGISLQNLKGEIEFSALNDG